MKFLNNIGIKSKLLLLVAFPLIGMIYLSSLKIYDAYDNVVNMNEIESIVLLSKKISLLVHETQKERGMTAGYLGSKGQKFVDEIEVQKQTTDIKINDFKKYVDIIKFSNYPKKLKNNISNAMKRINNLSTLRKKIIQQDIGTNEAIRYYTLMNQDLLDNIVLIAKFSNNLLISQELTAYSSFLFAKERAGNERAIGASTLSQDSFAKGMRAKFNNLIAEQNSYINSFIQYSSPDMKSYFEKTFKDSSISEVKRIRKIILESDEIGGFNIDATHWFNTISKKINLLKEIENEIAYNLRIDDIKLFERMEVATRLSDLLHATQLETAATSGYITSNGKRFKKELIKQRYGTNFRIKELKNAIKSMDKKLFKNNIQKSIKNILNNLSTLNILRKNIDKIEIQNNTVNDFFAKVNENILDTFALISDTGTNINENKDLTAFYSFLVAKEKAGSERSIGSNAFTKNKFLLGEKEKFVKLVTEQDNYMSIFKRNATPDILEFYEDTMNDKEIKTKVTQEVQRLRNIVLKSNEIGGFGIDAQYWFAQATQRINKLKVVDDYISDKILLDIKEIENKYSQTLMITLFLTVLSLIAVLLISKLISKRIVTALHDFKMGLGYFFQYAIREKDYIKPMQVNGSDEFAQMTHEMNEQIIKTENLIEQDKKVVVEINDIMDKVSNGFFGYTIKEKGATNEVEVLRNSINKMLADTKIKFDNINKVLSNYASNKYNFTLNQKEKEGIYGDLGTIYTSTSLLGNSLSGLMAMISNAGNELNDDTKILTSSSNLLSKASNTQAASLEETAAAVEEITSNIQSNSINVTKMSVLSDKLYSTAKLGNDLAHKTSSSIDEINNKVSAINEAINIIDQIAFQTNILSLNAAVEAATAGEAGKGFAVVAQEVRNLASRSAEAAKEIKELVEQASAKSKDGKLVATEMIIGYTGLNEIIVETKNIIDDVSIASKEQTNGIIQINDSVNELDKVTQENASTASQIDSLSTKINNLSTRLIGITSVAQFDDSAKKQALDISFTQSISQYKNDHIDFKVQNYAELDTFKRWSVVDGKSCSMGKWILKCESNNERYVNTPEWDSLKDIHDQVHLYVQEYVDKNHKKASNEVLRDIAAKIEDRTIAVFESMDAVLGVNGEDQ